MRIEDALTRPPQDFDSLEADEWTALAAAILKSLAADIGIAITKSEVCLPEPNETLPGFSFSIQTAPVGDTDMHMRFEGVGGLETHVSGTTVSASLLLFADGMRVSGAGRDYYELELHLSADGEIYWKRLGWQQDEFGEFEALTKWGQLLL